MRRAEEIGVGLARPVEIVHVASLAGDETLILFPADGCADPCSGHEILPCPRWPSPGQKRSGSLEKDFGICACSESRLQLPPCRRGSMPYECIVLLCRLLQRCLGHSLGSEIGRAS